MTVDSFVAEVRRIRESVRVMRKRADRIIELTIRDLMLVVIGKVERARVDSIRKGWRDHITSFEVMGTTANLFREVAEELKAERDREVARVKTWAKDMRSKLVGLHGTALLDAFDQFGFPRLIRQHGIDVAGLLRSSLIRAKEEARETEEEGRS